MDLKRYNQRIAAILGTTLLATVAITLLISLGAYVFSLLEDASKQPQQQGIPMVEGSAPETSNTTDTAQAVAPLFSIQNLIPLDTFSAQFLLPIGLVNPHQDDQRAVSTFTDAYRISKGSYPVNSYAGLYHNFLLFEQPSRTLTPIFQNHAALTRWAMVRTAQIEVLLFVGTTTDQNADGLLNAQDHQSLFAFYLEDKKLVEYGFDGQTVLSFKSIPKTNLVEVSVGVDYGHDGIYQPESEPNSIYLLDVKDRQAEALIPPALAAALQQALNEQVKHENETKQ